MINTEQIYKAAVKIAKQYPQIHIYNAQEEQGTVVIRFTANEKPPIKELAKDLEFQFNVPIKFTRITKSELGKVGSTPVLGELQCCGSFSHHCIFEHGQGCGYGLPHQEVEEKPKIEKVEEKQPFHKHSKKRKKLVRRVVI